MRMLRRADYVRDRKVLGGYMLKAMERCQYPAFWRPLGWAPSLLLLALAAQWNPIQPSYCKDLDVL